MSGKAVLSTVVGLVAGIVVALALLVAVEWFSSLVHPFPAGFDGNIPAHVRRYPQWILAVVVLMWGATATAATWVATRLGNRVAGGMVALLLASALVFNLAMLPYVMWFKVVMLAVFPFACLAGIRYGKRSVSPLSVSSAWLRSN